MPKQTPPGSPPAQDERARRLAAALRDNLRRRKAQLRGRDDAAAAAGADMEADADAADPASAPAKP